MNRKTNKAGIDLIKHFEGCKLKAYPDPATGGVPWTIGYGHTRNVKKGDIITQQQAEELLKQDLTFFENIVEVNVPIKLSDNEFAALVSFVYNVGPNNFLKSTLLKLLKAGDLKGAAKEFPKWNKAAGKVMKGLTARRMAEQHLFELDND